MAKFNLDEYELVEDRLKKFWADNPEGRVNTDVVNASADGTMVIVKAELFINKDDTTPVSSGLAQETKGLGGFANNEAWLENAESSALGRALANWKYQGRKKPRPTQEEMKKVKTTEPKKKQVVQETTTHRSSITDVQLKEMVFTMCNEDKNFAKKCYETSMTRLTMDKSISNNVSEWSNDVVDKFLLLVETYVTKFKKEFEDRANNTEVVNNIIETMGKVEQKESEEDMDFSNDDWKAGKEADPMTDAQKGFLETLITQCIDNGKDELAAEAKQYLNSDSTSKVTCSDMISKLKNALS